VTERGARQATRKDISNMPKMKTKRCAAKRFRVLGSGKVKRAKAGRRHILGEKSRKQKRRLRVKALVHETEVHHIERMLPYMGVK
jgi:large subunit ribosomal protein L35